MSTTAAATSTARVASVRDGDTVLLTSGVRVRLLQVDAPELGVECYGDEALAALARLVPAGSRLRLDTDSVLDRVDRHGRLLRYLYVREIAVNVELVRLGAAAPYFYRGVRGEHADELLAAAHDAQARRLGLWRACPQTRLRPGRAVATGPG